MSFEYSNEEPVDKKPRSICDAHNERYYNFVMAHSDETRKFIIWTLSYYELFKGKNKKTFLKAMLYASKDINKCHNDESYSLLKNYGLKLKPYHMDKYEEVDERQLEGTAIDYFRVLTDYEYIQFLPPYYYIDKFIKSNGLESELKSFGIDIKRYNIDIGARRLEIISAIEKRAENFEDGYFRLASEETKLYLKAVAAVYQEVDSHDEDMRIATAMLLGLCLMDENPYNYKKVCEDELLIKFFGTVPKLFEKFGISYQKAKDNLYDECKILNILARSFESFYGTNKSVRNIIIEYYPFKTKKLPLDISYHEVIDLALSIDKLIDIDDLIKNDSADIKKYLINRAKIIHYLTGGKKVVTINTSTYQLSQLICSYYMDLDVSKFLKHNGIMLEEFSSIDLSKIEDEPYDNDIILQLYRSVHRYDTQININTFEYFDINIYKSLLKQVYKKHTGNNLPDDIVEAIKDSLEQIQIMEQEKIVKDDLSGLDYDVYKYICRAAYVYKEINSIYRVKMSESKKVFISLALPIFSFTKYKDGMLTDYLEKVKFNYIDILRHYELTNAFPNDYSEKMFKLIGLNLSGIIKNHFSKNIFSSKEITIESIFSSLFNKDVMKSFEGLEYLESINIDIDTFDNLEEKMKECRDKKIKGYIDFIKYDEYSFDVFKRAYKILEDLKRSNVDKEHISSISLLLGFMLRKRNDINYKNKLLSDFYDALFDAYFVDVESVLETFKYNPTIDLNNIDTSDVTGEMIYQEYTSYILDIVYRLDLVYLDIGNIIRSVYVLDEDVIKKLINNYYVYDIFKTCCLAKQFCEPDENEGPVAVEYNRVLEYLKREQLRIKNMDISDDIKLSHLMETSSTSLSKYSSYCTNFILKMQKSSVFLNKREKGVNIFQVQEELSNIVDEFSPKFGVIKRVFGNKEDEMKTIDNIATLTESIKDQLIDIKSVMYKFNIVRDLFYEYIVLYKIYYEKFLSCFEKTDKDNTLYLQLKETLTNGKVSLELLSNQYEHIETVISEQEKLRILLTFVNNTIIPLITSIKLFYTEFDDEIVQEDMVKGIQSFINALVEYKFDDARESVERLKKLNLPEEYVEVFDSMIAKVIHADERHTHVKRMLKYLKPIK